MSAYAGTCSKCWYWRYLPRKTPHDLMAIGNTLYDICNTSNKAIFSSLASAMLFFHCRFTILLGLHFTFRCQKRDKLLFAPFKAVVNNQSTLKLKTPFKLEESPRYSCSKYHRACFSYCHQVVGRFGWEKPPISLFGAHLSICRHCYLLYTSDAAEKRIV